MKSVDWLAQADDLLRGRPAGRPWGLLLACGLFYGAVMGSFGGVLGERSWQVIYAAVKVPLLLLATLALSLPGYYVLNSLLGLRGDLAEALRGLIVSQAGLTVVLAALAPLTLLWYASSADYGAAILFNGLMFAMASVGAQILLWRCYRPLCVRRARHRWVVRAWVVVYAFVGIQMGWLLRPFVGSPSDPVQFVRPEAWDNAYVIVARLIWEQVRP